LEARGDKERREAEWMGEGSGGCWILASYRKGNAKGNAQRWSRQGRRAQRTGARHRKSHGASRRAALRREAALPLPPPPREQRLQHQQAPGCQRNQRGDRRGQPHPRCHHCRRRCRRRCRRCRCPAGGMPEGAVRARERMRHLGLPQPWGARVGIHQPLWVQQARSPRMRRQHASPSTLAGSAQAGMGGR
jgi:hypothetical protein